MPVSDQGVADARYTLVPRVLIFVRRGTSVLLLKGAPDKRLWAGRYNGLGGHVEAGEDLLSAARRELAEEAGLEADLRLCGTVLVDTGQTPGVGLFVFAGEWLRGEPRPSAEGRLEWVEVSAVPSLPSVEDVPALLEAVCRQRPGDPPFSARSFYDADGRLQIVFAMPG
ncbi:MAG: NUDIX domain-containing protein [Anaerolineales bacterium]